MRHVPDSAFWHAIDPEGYGWSVDTYLLANLVDLSVAANWQRSEDGQKGRNKPKPIQRPADRKAEIEKATDIEKLIAARKRRRPQR